MALNQVGLERLNTATTKKIGTNKNLIINGAMQVAQRGTSSTVDGYGTVDRFKCDHGTVDEAPTQAQVDVTSGTEPYTKGFRKAFKITNGNQTSGAQAASVVRCRYCVEAQDMANSGWNYLSSSSSITLSFYIKSSIAQNFFCDLHTSDGTAQGFSFQTGSLSADTWTKITKTIPGNSNLTFNNDNGNGIFININGFMGTNFTTSGHTLDTWGAFTGSSRMPDNTTTWYTTNNSTLEITGVQLEVGSVATDFEHKSFDIERDLCRRYFQRFNFTAANSCISLAYIEGSTEARMPFQFFKEMRDAPTFAVSSAAAFDAANGNQSRTASGIVISNANAFGCILIATTGSGLTESTNGVLLRNTSAPQHFDFSSEL